MSGQPEARRDWRAFLQTSEIDVFKTIENAILIAATDFPDKFLERKDHIMHTIITTALSLKSTMKVEKKSCEENTMSVEGNRNTEKGKHVVENFNEDEKNASNHEGKQDRNFTDDMNLHSFIKKRKMEVVSDTDNDNVATSVNGGIDDIAVDETYSSIVTIAQEGSAVAKEAKIENEDRTKETDVATHVLKIKNGLLAMKHMPKYIPTLLMKLDKMEITLEVLQATGIASVVSSFKTGYSRNIREIVNMLIEDWDILFDEWIARDSNALPNTTEVVVANINEVTIASLNEVTVSEAEALELKYEPEPKFVMGSGFPLMTSTGHFQFSQSPSKPPRAQSSYRTGSKGPRSIDEVTEAANKHKHKSTTITKPKWTNRIGTDRSSKGPSYPRNFKPFFGTGYKVAGNIDEPKHSTGVPGPSMTRRTSIINSSEGPSNPRSSEIFVDIERRSPTTAYERCIVTGQPAKMNPLERRQQTSTSSVRIGDSFGGRNNTFQTSQPGYRLQESKLATEKKHDVKNKKLEVPAPAPKNEEDSVKETLQIAKRKLQERLQKSQQAKRTNTSTRSTEKDAPIADLLSQYRRGSH